MLRSKALIAKSRVVAWRSHAVRHLATGGTTSSTAPAKSGGGLGRLLLLTALVTPPLYGAFLTRNDAEFRALFKEKLPSVYDTVAPLLKVDESNNSASEGLGILAFVQEKAPGVYDSLVQLINPILSKLNQKDATVDGISVKKLKNELEALSARWDQAGEQSVRFSRKEVADLEQVIKKAEQSIASKNADQETSANNSNASRVDQKNGEKSSSSSSSANQQEGDSEASAHASSANQTGDSQYASSTASKESKDTTESNDESSDDESSMIKSNSSQGSSTTPQSSSDTDKKQQSSHASQSDEIQVPPAREKLDALREKARNVRSRATEDTANTIKDMEKSLRGDLEVVLANDLSSLDEDGLRRRVVQLVLEIKDRNRWEALRMHELIKKHTEELVQKYDNLMQEQVDRYEELMRYEINAASSRAIEETQAQAADQLNRVIHTKEQQWHQATQQKLERQKMELAAEMDRRFKEAKSSIEAKAAEELKARVSALNAIKKKVTDLQDTLASRVSNEEQANNLQKVSLAVLDVQNALQKNPSSIGEEIKSLEQAGSFDPVIKAALASIPEQVRETGVPSEHEINQRFLKVHDACFEIALVPEDAGMLELAAARLVSALSFRGKPSPEDIPVEDKEPEKVLEKARFLLIERSDLDGAVKAMESLDDRVKNVAKDWLEAAKARVAVEQALQLLKAHVASKSA